MELYFIRHAQTQGNIERRYIGKTDEPLSEAGVACFCNAAYPAAGRVYASPMLRCVQTARILYPVNELNIVSDFRECDFGDFENRTYKELKDLPAYRLWIEGKASPPGGESLKAFQNRCCAAFRDIIDRALGENLQSAAFVVHGGTIMAILERFAAPRRRLYEWQPPNMGGWAAHTDRMLWDGQNLLAVTEKIEIGG